MYYYISILCILVFLVNPLHADILWEWDFTEEPEGWTWNGNWDFNDTGAYFYSHLNNYTGSYSAYALTSPGLSIPASADGKELDVSFWHEYDFDCGVYDGSIWLSIEARVILNSDTQYAYYYYGHEVGLPHVWSYHSASDSGTESVTVGPVQQNDTLIIEFYYFYAENGSYQNYCDMDWIVTNLIVEETDTELSRCTWGAIKSESW